MQQHYILLISLLAGLVAAGFVWFLWDLAAKVHETLDAARVRRRLKRDAAALAQQAKEPAPAERPK
ncbi:MAG: hypothetical protein HYV26_17940 [Candidatus Hydrogenedentes bacterium]|nr:hypothetical protein [Candidatus Hydrogenedentota bacterium]MBI3118583.1 hypothetical protein [Candidatus Hydrogenedentota bacterium]